MKFSLNAPGPIWPPGLTGRVAPPIAAAISLAAALAGCHASSSVRAVDGTSAVGGPAPQNLTYYKDAKAIIDAKCGYCHKPNTFAPFSLQTYEEVSSHAALIKPYVASRQMPPWLASHGCNEYEGDRSLSDAQLSTLVSWIDQGAKAGDPADAPPPPAPTSTDALSRIDLVLKVPVQYSVQIHPDEYRCFVLDPGNTTDKFVTGFGVVAGNAKIVHHVIAYDVDGPTAARYAAFDGKDGQPGYPCFGGPLPNADSSSVSASIPGMLAAWAPGTPNADFVPGTGIRLAVGHKVVMQMHYNTASLPAMEVAADQTELKFRIDDAVEKEAHMMFWTNPFWVLDRTMKIPAGAPDTMYRFSYDLTKGVGLFLGMQPSQLTLYSVGTHMHVRGTKSTIALHRGDGSDQCLLDVQRWNFHWQGGYAFKDPVTVKPGDQLSIECHWDNSGALGPVLDDLNWGEGTNDEMCLGILYLTH